MTHITARNIARNAAAMWTRKAAALLVEAQEIDMNPDDYAYDAKELRAKAYKAAQLARQWHERAEKDERKCLDGRPEK